MAALEQQPAADSDSSGRDQQVRLPVELKEFNHIAMQTRDVQRLAAFYQDVLGFRRLRRVFDGIFQGVWLGGGGTMVHIMSSEAYAEVQRLHAKHDWQVPGYEAPPRPPPPIPSKPLDGRIPLEDHLAFVLHDIRATRRRLKALGIEAFNVKDEMQNHLWILDPDGRTIELTVDSPWPPYEDVPNETWHSALPPASTASSASPAAATVVRSRL